jgi:hypothetical protein
MTGEEKSAVSGLEYALQVAEQFGYQLVKRIAFKSRTANQEHFHQVLSCHSIQGYAHLVSPRKCISIFLQWVSAWYNDTIFLRECQKNPFCQEK